MANLIQIRGGLDSAVPTLSAKEFGFSTDAFRLYIGDGTDNHESVLSSATDIGYPQIVTAGVGVTWGALDSSSVGLGNVDNTSDVDKPVSIATSTALNLRIPKTYLAAAYGVATLDASIHIPLAQLPASIVGGVDYQGVWDASTNTPTIPTAAAANKGWYYKVSVAAVVGNIDWKVGDWNISDGITWDQISNTDSVSSVNAQTGAVVLTTDDVAEGSSNLYFTEARVTANSSVTANTAKVTFPGFGTTASLVPHGNDTRFSNARTPLVHASTHESGGSDVIAFDSLADGSTYKKFLSTERTKLTGIATAATANDTNAFLLARANHTGTESYVVLSDYQSMPIDGGTW